MRSLNEFFDKIYCIHVEGLLDRKKCIDTVAETLNCEIEIIKAHTPSDCDLPSNMGRCLPAEYACSVSHLSAWEKIILDETKRPLILEDDVVINPNIDVFQMLDDKRDLLFANDVDISFLGLNYRDRAKLVKIDDHLVRVIHAFALHAYAPPLEVLKELSQDLNRNELYDNPQTIDIKMANVYHRLNAIAIYPPIFVQKNGFSLIQNKIVDYKGVLI